MKLPPLPRLTTYQLYALFVALLMLIVLFVSPSHVTLERYHLNGASYRVLLFATVALPSFLTWAAAFYGYEQLRRYSEMIRSTREGEAFAYLSRGSRWVVLYLPVTTILSIWFMGIANSLPHTRAIGLAIVGYIAVIMSIVAFTNVSTGARLLCDSTDTRPTLPRIRFLTFAFILMGVLYCYLIIRHSLQPGGSPYSLPLSWQLITMVVPYFFAWFMGLLAVLDIDAYASNVSGLLYQKSLRQLSIGILTIILSSILLQYANSANTERGRLVLGGILLIRYALFATISAGFVLIGNSAKKLQQIEKI